MTTPKTIADGLSEAQRRAIATMEWTGEYFNPPKACRRALAQRRLLDPMHNFAVTSLGEAVRAELEAGNAAP